MWPSALRPRFLRAPAWPGWPTKGEGHCPCRKIYIYIERYIERERERECRERPELAAAAQLLEMCLIMYIITPEVFIYIHIYNMYPHLVRRLARTYMSRGRVGGRGRELQAYWLRRRPRWPRRTHTACRQRVYNIYIYMSFNTI